MNDTPPAASRRRKPPALDRIDLRILDVLRENGRITNQALAEIVGLSPRPTLERVRRLERSGVIQSYAAQLDAGLVGHEIVGLCQIVMRDPSLAARQRLEQRLVSHSHVLEVHVVNGEADYLVRFVASSLSEYEEITHDLLADPSLGVARMETAFVLKTLKEFRGYPVGQR
jgi:DNA-binding Lrp family transcriptional regulator